MKTRIIRSFLFVCLLSLAAFSCQRDEVPGPSLRETEPTVTVPTTSEDPDASSEIDPMVEVRLVTPGNEVIRTSLAFSAQDQAQGLSGVASEDFAIDQGKLFFYLTDATRTFWMPDTYFDLDLFYLDPDLEVIDVVRDLPHHEGRSGSVPRAPAIRSRHVLELRADSRIGNELRVGDHLRWESPLTLRQTESKIRQRR